MTRFVAFLTRPWFWVAFVAIAVGAPIAAVVIRDPSPRPPLPSYGDAPGFSFTNQRGEPFTGGDLAGKVWVADFIFTRCPSICPLVSARMAELQKRTNNLGDRFHMVSFSVDPEHDTPDVLAAYAREYHASATRWTFLTGPYLAVQHVTQEGFKQAMAKLPPGDEIANLTHGTHFVLVDAVGRIRGFYDSADDARFSELVRDVGLLVNRGE